MKIHDKGILAVTQSYLLRIRHGNSQRRVFITRHHVNTVHTQVGKHRGNEALLRFTKLESIITKP
jgi:hypothetical protein